MKEEFRKNIKWVVLEGTDYFEATDSAHVEAWDSAHVEARDSAHVVARDSAHVVARGSAHVEAWGSAHVEARDSAHVVARDSAHVVARDSAHVEARDSAHVVATDSAHVVARDFSSVVCKCKKTVKIKKGKKAIIIYPQYPSKITEWAALKNIPIKKGYIALWKAVNESGNDFYTGKISYLKDAIAPDWNSIKEIECGLGLHLADSPSGARCFVAGKKFRLFQVSAAVKDCVCFPGNPRYPMKIRARACRFEKEFPCDYNEWDEKE